MTNLAIAVSHLQTRIKKKNLLMMRDRVWTNTSTFAPNLPELALCRPFGCYLKWGWNFLVVQWLGLHISTAVGTGSIPGQGNKILRATRCSQKKNFFFK